VTEPARLLLHAIRLDGPDPDNEAERALEAAAEGVGGFLLFGGTRAGVPALVAELRQVAGRPLWVAADLERGAGQQVSGASTLPPPAALASHPRAEEAVRLAARLTALEARALGINWVLAPVLDLDVEPRNPIVQTRAFGSDPVRVAALGLEWVRACQAVGVAACAKHFPGHGRTVGDSHSELPVVGDSRAELERDLVPFRAVAGEVASVMTAHVAYPALGCEGPATLSRQVLEGVLRRELGFGGLVVTDALVMAGLAGADDAGAAAEGWRAVRALRAGCDLLLYPSDARLTARTVGQAAAADPALAGRLEAAAERSAAALVTYGSVPGPGSLDGAAGDPEVLPPFDPEGEALTRLAAACIRPIGPRAPERVDAWLAATGGRVRVGVVSDDGPAGAPALGEAFAAELGRRGFEVERVGGLAGAGAESARAELRAARGVAAVHRGARSEGAGSDGVAPLLILIEATPRAWKGRAGLSEEARRRLQAAGRGRAPVLVVVLGHPRIADELGTAAVCAWASEPVMERGAAAWLASRAAGRGS